MAPGEFVPAPIRLPQLIGFLDNTAAKGLPVVYVSMGTRVQLSQTTVWTMAEGLKYVRSS